MGAAVELLDASGFETLLLGNRVPLRITRGYWDELYNVSGWRNCASLNRGLVDPREFRSLLQQYASHAAPLDLGLYPRGFEDVSDLLHPDPLGSCPRRCEATTTTCLTRQRVYSRRPVHWS